MLSSIKNEVNDLGGIVTKRSNEKEPGDNGSITKFLDSVVSRRGSKIRDFSLEGDYRAAKKRETLKLNPDNFKDQID